MSLDLSSWDIAKDGAGEACEILRPDSPVRRQLLDRPLPRGIRLHLIAGDGGPIEPADGEKFSQLIERLIAKLQPSAEYAENLRYLSTADELVVGTGDGAVTIASATAVKDRHSEQLFHRSHIGLLLVKPKHGKDEVMDWIQSQLMTASAAASTD